MGESFGDSKYILVLKDHASHYCELVVADTTDSSVTVEALLAWHARFGVPPTWISDQGSHFKNEVVAELSRRLRTQQEFTPAYCPWINGSVERVNRDILQVIRTMILEYKINHTDWPYLMPMVQASLNHTAVPSLGNKAPVELFTGLPCPTPLREFYLPDAGELKEVPEIDEFLADLRASIQEMHRAVKDKRLKQRLLNKKRERGENAINFTEEDYVLRSRVDEKCGNKLLVTWVGPYRVLRADAHSFLIQHLITGAELDVHASILKFYADASLDVTEDLREHISSQGIVLAIEKLKEHRWNHQIRDYEVLVQWKGLEAIEDSYEPLTSLARDVTVLVAKYVATADQGLQEHWQRVATGGERQRQTADTTATTSAKPARKNRRRQGRQQQRRPAAVEEPPHDSPAEVSASATGAPAASAPQAVERPGPEQQPDATASEVPPHAARDRRRRTPRRLPRSRRGEVQVEGASRRTRSRTAGAPMARDHSRSGNQQARSFNATLSIASAVPSVPQYFASL
ncbi:hypothetical protein PF003_g6792 [Phytophthora fragariae]|nr:hypothetical protein PF003_g6792 [Phytophthora fragariae]